MSFRTSTLIGCNDKGLRDYQLESKHKILELWDKYNRLMLQMPTGTGKTVLFGSIVNTLNSQLNNLRRLNVKILIVAHRVEILDQISKVLQTHNLKHGIVQGNEEQNWREPIQVASTQSILSKKNKQKAKAANFDFIIIDEAHHTLANTYVELFNTFPEARFLGVTATPWRYNHASFKDYFDCLIQSHPVQWFIDNGYLAEFSYVSIKRESYTQNLVNNTSIADTGDFSEDELDKEFNCKKIRAKLLKSYLKYAEGKKGIVYAINIKHAHKIAELYSENGINTEVVDSQNTTANERAEIVSDFRKGKIDVLVNVDIFTEGFDVPDIGFIQLARPTRSLVIYLQQVGRGLRKNGDANTLILDNVGLYNYFGLPNAKRKWMMHFIGKETDEDKQIEETKKATEKKSYDRDITEDDEEMTVVFGDVDVNANYDNIAIKEVEDDVVDEKSDINKVLEELSAKELSVKDKNAIDNWIKNYKDNNSLPKEKNIKKQREKYSGKSLEYFEDNLKKLQNGDEEISIPSKQASLDHYIPEDPNPDKVLSKETLKFVEDWNITVWIPCCDLGVKCLYNDELIQILYKDKSDTICQYYSNVYRRVERSKYFSILREIKGKYEDRLDDYSRSLIDGAQTMYDWWQQENKVVFSYLDQYASLSSKLMIKSVYPYDDDFFDKMFCNWDGSNVGSFLKLYADMALFYEISHLKRNMFYFDSVESQKWSYDGYIPSLRISNLLEKTSPKLLKKSFLSYAEYFKEKLSVIMEYDRNIRVEEFNKNKEERPAEYDEYDDYDDYAELNDTRSCDIEWHENIIRNYIDEPLEDIEWVIHYEEI